MAPKEAVFSFDTHNMSSWLVVLAALLLMLFLCMGCVPERKVRSQDTEQAETGGNEPQHQQWSAARNVEPVVLGAPTTMPAHACAEKYRLAMSQMENMGFSEDASLAALRAHHWNVSAAADAL